MFFSDAKYTDHFGTTSLDLQAFFTKYGFPISEWALCSKYCWGACEQNSIVDSVPVDDWTAEWAIIVSTDIEISISDLFVHYNGLS